MLDVILARLQQKHRTIRYPHGPPPPLPDRFRGRPVMDRSKCPDGCRACVDACPTGAIDPGPPARIDLGKCLFCTDCVAACPAGALTHAVDHRLAARRRGDLVVPGDGAAVETAGLALVE